MKSNVLCAIGITMLLVGTAVYVFDRPPELSLIGSTVSSFHVRLGALGAIAGNFPSFAHTFAFALLTAVLLGGARLTNIAVCLGWLVINVAFEIGQHPELAESIAKTVPAWFRHVFILDRTTTYFLSGTFDPLDILFAALGALTAYIVIVCTDAPGVCHED